MFRKFIRGTTSSVFKLCLFMTAVTWAASSVLTNPSPIKQALSDSKLYDNLVTSVLNESTKNLKPQGGEQLPLDRPEIREAAQKALPPETVKESFEQFIDSMYAWTESNAERPDFKIDLTESKNTFTVALADYAEKRFNELPACTLAQLQGLNPEVDPFTVECRPPGLTATAVRQKVTEQISNNNEVFGNTIITADTFKNEQGKSVFENAQQAREGFRLIKSLPLIFGALSIITGVALFFLHERRKTAVRSIAGTLLGVGLFLMISTFVFTLIFNRMNDQRDIASSVPNELQDSLLSIVRSIGDAYNMTIIRFGVFYALAGTCIFLALWVVNKRNRPGPVPVPSKNPTNFKK
jgi:hypothetical protein